MQWYHFKTKIDQWIEEEFSQATPLHEIAFYSLEGGKRFRPGLMLLIGHLLNQNLEVFKAPALALEAFHTASLIADDLPFMDDACERRRRPSCHKQFDCPKALLTSYALIAFGYDQMARSALEPARALLCIQEISKSLGFEGTCLGQLLDLTITESTQLESVILLKTATLFELCFVLAWIFSDQDLEKLPLIKKTARHFGIAFQIADDLLDCEEDKSIKNYAHTFGKEEAFKRVDLELEAMDLGLKELNLGSLKIKELIALFLQTEG